MANDSGRLRSAWDGTDAQLAAGMRSLKGERCTLSHQRPLADEVQRRGLMKFHEWPSGHWAYTQRGLNWLCDGEWDTPNVSGLSHTGVDRG